VKEQTDDAEENFVVNGFLTVADNTIIPFKWSYRIYEKHGEIFGVYIVSTNYVCWIELILKNSCDDLLQASDGDRWNGFVWEWKY
jgi:hypothetical protein